VSIDELLGIPDDGDFLFIAGIEEIIAELEFHVVRARTRVTKLFVEGR
jgi:hypothetical protein